MVVSSLYWLKIALIIELLYLTREHSSTTRCKGKKKKKKKSDKVLLE